VIARERDRAGVRVDLHLDHVTAIREGALAAIEGAAPSSAYWVLGTRNASDELFSF
jgi:hypothetical protein